MYYKKNLGLQFKHTRKKSSEFGLFKKRGMLHLERYRTPFCPLCNYLLKRHLFMDHVLWE